MEESVNGEQIRAEENHHRNYTHHCLGSVVIWKISFSSQQCGFWRDFKMFSWLSKWPLLFTCILSFKGEWLKCYSVAFAVNRNYSGQEIDIFSAKVRKFTLKIRKNSCYRNDFNDDSFDDKFLLTFKSLFFSCDGILSSFVNLDLLNDETHDSIQAYWA